MKEPRSKILPALLAALMLLLAPRLRRQAPEYGLDPNRWFRNVENIVASNVGREPVRYVGNIYKYYLAYRRLRDLQREPGRD